MATPWGISVTVLDRIGEKAKSITSCDNAFVTNILPLPLRFRAKNNVPLPLRFRAKNNVPLPLRFRAKNIYCPKRLIRRSQEALLCAKA
ncbi:hypothetical protein ACQKNC_02470 [Lysinibacillus sp. NPDC094177]|uniref:hypothetical protein n=1 Tax=Lysinibacillus sp. NPDC094177 TaxID=3390580 RepID=UPI003D07ED8D